MKIIVRRDRDDKGWVATMEGSPLGLFGNRLFTALLPALLAVNEEYPAASVRADERRHYRLGNGIVFLRGDENLRNVRFV